MSTRSALCPVQVGRDEDVARLGDNLDLRQVTLISGTAGVGKTRLARDALRLGEERGLGLLQGQCTLDASIPYEPFVSALRRRTRTLDHVALDALFEGPARLAAALLPEVAAGRGLPPEPPRQEDLFAAVWHVLHRLATPEGCVLVVEDLHWADADSLRLLSYLVREVADLGVWLVATYRSDELHRRHPLTATLSEMARARAYDEIAVAPLGHEDLRSMVSAIFDGTEIGDEFVGALLDRTGGNPFFVEELVKVLLERGDVYEEAGDWARRTLADIEMPPTVREALLARVRTLDEHGQAILQLAAVAGDQLDPPVLARAATSAPRAVEDAIGSGLGLQLLTEQREGIHATYAFRHALTREALADELVGPDRQRAHRRIAEAIAEVYATRLDSVAAQLADHYAAAGDMARAVEFDLRAARRAAAGYALDEAGRRFEQALRLLAAGSDVRLAILVEAAEALYHGPDVRLGTSFATEARDLARARSDPVAEARALSTLQGHLWDAGDTPEALSLMREASALVRGRDDRAETVVTSRFARLLCLADQKEEAALFASHGLELADRVGDLRSASGLHGTRMLLAFFGTEFDEELDAAVAAARAAGDERAEENAVACAGYATLWCGDFTRSERLLLRAIELSRRVTPHDRYVVAGYAWLLSLMGRYPEALCQADSVGASARVPSQIVALTARYEVAEKSDADKAGAVVDELLAMARRTGEAQRSVPAQSAKARHTLVTAGAEAAAPLFWEALARTTTARRSGSHWPFSPDMARGLRDEGQVDELERWSGAVATLTRHDTHPHNQAALHLTAAHLDAARGDVASARLRFRSAAAIYREMPCPAREAECLLGLADVEWLANDPAESGRAARDSLELAERIGAPLIGHRAVGATRRAETPSVLATVLVTDIVRSTEHLTRMGDRAWSVTLERHHAIVRRELERFGGREIDTAGDGFLATFDTPAQGIRCATSVRDSLLSAGIEVRAGLHAGECQVLDGKVVGLTVHVAARINALAEPGEVLVSRTLRELVAGSGFRYHDRGLHELRGVPGEWTLFAVEP